MKTTTAFALLVAASLATPLAFAQSGWRVSSDQTVSGFKFPESAAYDPREKVLYVGNFGGEKLDPAGKTGTGYISKVSLNGKIIQERAFPTAGMETMHKPKGIWIYEGNLWVTDIDAVWQFDLKSKKGRRLAVPLGFANDPAVMDNVLYITDNRNDKLVKVTPAHFLNVKNPKVEEVFSDAKINPNGACPSRSGVLYLVGAAAPPPARGHHDLGEGGPLQAVAVPMGRLDGCYELKDGSLLITEWNNGSLTHWSEKTGRNDLARGFKGPADFAVVPGEGGSLTVVVPDLVQRHLRFIHIRPQ